MTRPRRAKTKTGDPELLPPPRTFQAIRPVLVDVPASTRLYRLYSPVPYGTGPTTFRDVGPINRFDHHQPMGGKPTRHAGRGVIYAGADVTCCVGEFFGDAGVITLTGNRLARLRVTPPSASWTFAVSRPPRR